VAPSAGLATLGLQASPSSKVSAVEGFIAANDMDGIISTNAAQVVDGGGWKTTFLLVNTGSEPARFWLLFRQSSGALLRFSLNGVGSVSEFNDVVPAGGIRVVETDGRAASASAGWVELVAGPSVAAAALLAQNSAAGASSVASVPFQPADTRRFAYPFENSPGSVIGLALANPAAAETVEFEIQILNEEGAPLGSLGQTLAPLQHTALALPINNLSLDSAHGTLLIEASSGLVTAAFRFTADGTVTPIPLFAE